MTPLNVSSETASAKLQKSASKYEKQRPGLERLYMETQEQSRVIGYIENDSRDYQALDYYLWEQDTSSGVKGSHITDQSSYKKTQIEPDHNAVKPVPYEDSPEVYYLDDVGTQIIEEKAEEEEMSSRVVTNRVTHTETSSVVDADISEEVSVSRKSINSSVINMKMRPTTHVL